MLVVQDAWNNTDVPRGAVATIGNYDGIHRGQKAIVDRVVERAGEIDAPAVVITFDPHPLAVLRPKEAPKLLTTEHQKERLLEAAGIEAMLVIRFDREVSEVDAEGFVRDFLVKRLELAELYVGSSFKFGRGRDGDLALIRRLADELGFVAGGVDEVTYDGAAISSSRIRDALGAGDVEAAAAMLGRCYSLEGRVTRGDRMGQRLGWPTVNMDPDNELVPLDGVYATRVSFEGFPAGFDSVTNIGTRPTVYENYQRVVESHVLDFMGDVYDQRTELFFHKRLREERIFPTIMDLSQQIRRDVDSTREYFFRLRQEE